MREQGVEKAGAWQRAAALFVSAAAVALSGCTGTGIQSTINPKSSQSYEIAILWWIMLALGTLVLLAVTLLAAAAVMRRSSAGPTRELSDRQKRNLVLIGGVIAPVAAVFGLVIYSTAVGRYTSGIPESAPVTIEITGHQWWWDVKYQTDRGIAARTANEIHIPVGVPVKFVLRSQDVIHSFWMPNFQGKTDLIPGRINYTWVTAYEPGVFRGQCAEFCGLQHAKMAFMVVARPEEEFYGWLEQQSRPAQAPVTPEQLRGQQAFLSSPCIMCHTVRGTTALGSVAPDLTHVGSRLTIGAGALPNTRGHMGGWLANPQSIKPGTRMPNMYLKNEDLNALIDYLESLK